MKKSNKISTLIVIAFVMVMGLFTTGCKGGEKVVETAKGAGEAVAKTASDAGEAVKYQTRQLEKQEWTNPSTGTHVLIEERRNEGDFKVTLTYKKDDVNGKGVTSTEDAQCIMYVDKLTDEFIDSLRDC